MKITGIYKIESKLKPERIYIGSAMNINQRWIGHLNVLKRNCHRNSRLQNHYNKYGKNDLIFSILIGCDKQDLISTEQFYIDAYNPFFNICKVAGNSLGRIVSDETRQKMSEKARGRPAWNKGKKGCFSKESRIQMAKVLKGKKRPPFTEEHKKNMSIAKTGTNHPMYGKHQTEEWKKNKREALQRIINSQSKLVFNTETGIYYDSIKEAADTMNMKRSTLEAMLRGENKNRTKIIYVN